MSVGVRSVKYWNLCQGSGNGACFVAFVCLVSAEKNLETGMRFLQIWK